MPTLKIELNEPHVGQKRVMESAKRFNVLECGRRWGKTSLAIQLAVASALPGNPVGWFAPTYKILADAWRQLEAIVAPTNPSISVQEHRIELVGGGSIECWSLDQPDAGRSRKYKRVVVDEAGIVRDLEVAWTQAIRPTLTDLKGDAWFLGTPRGRTFFHNIYNRGQSGDANWASWRLPTIENPTLDPAEIEEARLEYAKAGVPQIFDQEYLGIPADDGGNPFGLAAIAACQRERLAQGPAVAFGVDLAKSYDFTVVCGLNSAGEVCVLERWQSDWGQTQRRIIDLIGDTSASIDSTGVGDPLVEAIQKLTPHVTGYKFSQQSKQQLMEGLAAAIQQGRVMFPAGWLRNELDSFEYEYSGRGVRYSCPSGLHDDGVMALALAIQCRAHHRIFVMSGGGVFVPPPAPI